MAVIQAGEKILIIDMGKNDNAIMFASIDREDGWVNHAIVFKVKNTDTFKDACEEIKEELSHSDFIKKIVEMHDLIEDVRWR